MPTIAEILVFDLDDTLYLERDFARSGFGAAGDWIRLEAGIEGFDAICEKVFSTGDRARVFDRALNEVGLSHRADLLQRLIEIYRRHEASITLAPDARRYLEEARDTPRAIITDGPAATQKAKIKALGLENFVDLIICTDDWGRDMWKPHARAFETVETWSGADPRHIVYVADNPLKDFVTPRRRGWTTVRMARQERVHRTVAPEPNYEAHATIVSFDELDDCLKTISCGDG